MRLSRITIFLLIFSLLLQPLTLAKVQAAPDTPAHAAQNKPLPPFPEDAERPAIDWSGVDWQEDVAMPDDREALYRAIDELERQGRSGEARALALPKRAMWDDAVMTRYGVPEEIKEIVRWYRVTRQKLVREDLKQDLQEYTRLRIRAKQAEQGKRVEPGAAQARPEQNPAHTIDLQNAPQLDVRRAKQKSAPQADSIWIDVPQEVKNQPAPAATLKKPNTVSRADDRGFSIARMLLSFFATPAHAYYEPTIPLIAYYDGIESHPIEYFLYYLSQTQNEDGSWGAFNEYETTGNIALLLSNFNKTDTDQYALAVQYLINTAPENDREAAFKARLMYGLGEPYQTLLDEVLAHQNTDFGFGMADGLASDAETSLEVIFALETTQYRSDEFLDAALLYALNRIEPNGALRYATDANPSYHLINKALSYLKPLQAATLAYDGGSIVVQDKVNLMIAYLADRIDAETGELSGGDAIDQLETLESFQLYGARQDLQDILFASSSNLQNADGSFGTSLYAGIAAMRALSQPDIAVIGMQSIGGLANGTPAVFGLIIKNIGYQTISDMHLYDFVDGYQFNTGYDIGSWGVTLAPGQETTLSINFNDTASFVGDTKIMFYLEGENEYTYDNNWLGQAFSFAANTQGDPALPLYYIAQKHDISGNPAINIRWQAKEDSNRKNYVIVFREKGAQNWSYYGIDTAWNGAFLSGPFTEDGVYEVTAGVLHLDATTITYFSNATEVQMSGDEAKYQGSASGVITIGNQPGAGIAPFAYGGGFGSASDAHGAFSFFNLPNGTSALWVDEESYAYFEELVTRFSVGSSATTTNIRLHTRYKEDAQAPAVAALWMPFNSNYVIKNQQENLLQVSGSDNVALKEADFYYWNPDDAAWLYLGTQAASGGTAEFNWHVPGELEGSGYKIRAALWDWRGNQSAFAEWGPFEIKDATPPTRTVSVAGLTNNEWPAGEQRTIIWNIEAQNTLMSIEAIRLQYGFGSERIASNYDISQQSLAYTIPAYSSYITDAAYVSIEACDANQNCATLESDPFAITDTSPPVSTPWGTPVAVENFGSTYGLSRSLIASFMPSPGVHEYLYLEYDGLAHEAGGRQQRLVYRTLTLDSWSEPVVLKEYWYHAGETNEVAWSNFSAAQDAAGGIHIAYEHEENIGSWQESRDASEIRYLHFDGASVVSDIQLSSSATDAASPVVASATDGTAHVAWREGYSYASSSGTPMVRHVSGNGISNWGAIETVSTITTDAFALTTSAVAPMVVFKSADALYASKRSSGSWSSPVALAGLDAENASNLHLFAPTNGAYQLFYQYGSSSTGWQYRARWAEFTLGADGSSAQVVRQKDIVNASGEDSLQNLVVLPALSGAYHILYINSVPGGNYRAGHAFFAHGATNFGRYVSSEIMNVDSSVLAGASLSNAVRIYFSGYLSGQPQLLYNGADYAAYAGTAAQQESINVRAIVE